MNPFSPRLKMDATIEHLKGKKRILFLTTSNRWAGEKGGEKPKSTKLAERLAELVGNDRVTIIDATKLKIYPCEGNVSTERGNTCGEKKAALKDDEKNPSGCHRCWASLNNPDDELWQISKPLLESDAVVFFGSIRWGQMNAYYQKLIERLTWLENRHSTLGEENLLKEIDAGIIAIGQNWNGDDVVRTQKQVLDFFGFKTPEELSWHWSYSHDAADERPESYQEAVTAFEKAFLT
jgi:multimeric flavodoxin WrbA